MIYLVESDVEHCDRILDCEFNVIEEFQYEDSTQWAKGEHARSAVFEYGYHIDNIEDAMRDIPDRYRHYGEVWHRIPK